VGEARQSVTIVNRRGLHARASAKFVGAVAVLPESVKVTVTKAPHSAATSARACSIIDRNRRPSAWTLDGLPSTPSASSMAARASGNRGAEAL
jgi:hypothetical protein